MIVDKKQTYLWREVSVNRYTGFLTRSGSSPKGWGRGKSPWTGLRNEGEWGAPVNYVQICVCTCALSPDYRRPWLNSSSTTLRAVTPYLSPTTLECTHTHLLLPQSHRAFHREPDNQRTSESPPKKNIHILILIKGKNKVSNVLSPSNINTGVWRLALVPPPSHMTSILLNSSMDLSGTDTGEVKCHHRPQQSEQGVTPLMVTDGFQQLTGTGKPEDSFPRETLWDGSSDIHTNSSLFWRGTTKWPALHAEPHRYKAAFGEHRCQVRHTADWPEGNLLKPWCRWHPRASPVKPRWDTEDRLSACCAVCKDSQRPREGQAKADLHSDGGEDEHLVNGKVHGTGARGRRGSRSPLRGTAGHWCCARSPQSHCCGPSEILPSPLWICRVGRRRWQNSRPSGGWPLCETEGERNKVSFKAQLDGFTLLQIKFMTAWCELLLHVPV